jgi:hypothetical protein
MLREVITMIRKLQPSILIILVAISSSQAVGKDLLTQGNPPPVTAESAQSEKLQCKEIVVAPVCPAGSYMFDVKNAPVGRTGWSSAGEYPVIAFCCKA